MHSETMSRDLARNLYCYLNGIDWDQEKVDQADHFEHWYVTVKAALSAVEPQPAPSVAVKAFESNKEMIEAFGVDRVREGSRMCFEADGTDTWEDYCEVPFHVLDRIRYALSAQVQDVATHRNKKRGSEYVLIGVGKMQVENWCEFTTEVNHAEGREYAFAGKVVDMREVAIYRSVDDGSLWVRPVEEFNDGRFEAIPAATAKQEG